MQAAEKPAIPTRGDVGTLEERATLWIDIVARALIVFQYHHPINWQNEALALLEIIRILFADQGLSISTSPAIRFAASARSILLIGASPPSASSRVKVPSCRVASQYSFPARHGGEAHRAGHLGLRANGVEPLSPALHAQVKSRDQAASRQRRIGGNQVHS
jgi:hypothetical protein